MKRTTEHGLRASEPDSIFLFLLNLPFILVTRLSYLDSRRKVWQLEQRHLSASGGSWRSCGWLTDLNAVTQRHLRFLPSAATRKRAETRLWVGSEWFVHSSLISLFMCSLLTGLLSPSEPAHKWYHPCR